MTHGYSGNLADLSLRVQERLATLDAGRIVARVWDRDHTVWKPDPTEIADRLGWLTLPATMAAETPGLKTFASEVAAEGFTQAILLGMGGSSLAPEVMRATLGVASGALDLAVLDTTDPSQIAATERSLDLAKTLFIVSSKSGGTIETRSHFDYFWSKVLDGRHFVIITDRGSALEQLGVERSARRIFRNPADIGGRYSGLSLFGLVPAALMGVNLDRFLGGALQMARDCKTSPAADNPGAWLGAVLGEAALAGRDKVTFFLPPEMAALGYWLEQLIAESTGKEGRGIVPVEGEQQGSPEVYGTDRMFVATGEHEGLDELESAGFPMVRIPYTGPYQLGAEFFRWEFAVAVAGHILGINPFDQPSVQEAKDRTSAILSGEEVDAVTPSLAETLALVQPGDYIAITAYLPKTKDNDATLQAARHRLRDRFRVATTVGYGPRFLHSTGQLHKGGANNGVFLQVVADHAGDIPVPGRPYTFGKLQTAQALGDLASLRAHGRRVARISLKALAEV